MTRTLRYGLSAVATLIVLTVIVGWWWLHSSLPLLDGELASAISQPVHIERDARGVVTVKAKQRSDAAFATGFVHAQDRYFQMDLNRRFAAGELAALFGEVALERDKRQRRYQMRQRAAAAIEALPANYREFLQAYVDGVNAGLSALGKKPFEYTLLGTDPAPWVMADSVLVLAAMYFDLQGSDPRIAMGLGRLQACFEPEVAEFLACLLYTSPSPRDS